MAAQSQTHTTERVDLPDPSVHVICCNPDLAACGSDRSGRPFLPDDAPVDCPLCRLAEDEDLPCGDPDCPYREDA